jgi:hypothetical protein
LVLPLPPPPPSDNGKEEEKEKRPAVVTAGAIAVWASPQKGTMQLCQRNFSFTRQKKE